MRIVPSFNVLFVIYFFFHKVVLFFLQVKAIIRGESPPFSAGQLEGIAATINMQTRVSRKLCNSSLRYWIIEYLRRQPKERKFRALVLRFIKDRNAALLLIEVNLSLIYIHSLLLLFLVCVLVTTNKSMGQSSVRY